MFLHVFTMFFILFIATIKATDSDVSSEKTLVELPSKNGIKVKALLSRNHPLAIKKALDRAENYQGEFPKSEVGDTHQLNREFAKLH